MFVSTEVSLLICGAQRRLHQRWAVSLMIHFCCTCLRHNLWHPATSLQTKLSHLQRDKPESHDKKIESVLFQPQCNVATGKKVVQILPPPVILLDLLQVFIFYEHVQYDKIIH